MSSVNGGEDISEINVNYIDQKASKMGLILFISSRSSNGKIGHEKINGEAMPEHCSALWHSTIVPFENEADKKAEEMCCGWGFPTSDKTNGLISI